MQEHDSRKAGTPSRASGKQVRRQSGELITLVDMDHYIEGTFDPNADWIVARAYEMHDHLVETLHEHVVTPEAIEVWK